MVAARNLDHPVWDVYDLRMTARLNTKYYSVKLDRFRIWNNITEIALAVTAPSSAIAGLWFWETNWGKMAWQYLAAVTAIIALIKPFARLSEKIRRYEEILGAYRGLEHDLNLICIEIKQTGCFGPRHRKQFSKALERKGKIAQAEENTRAESKLSVRLEQEVINELPPERFFVPKE